MAVEQHQNYKERISSLGKQSALWAVTAVAASVGGLVLAYETVPLVAAVGLAAGAFSGFKSVQKLWQRHKLHKEAAAVADDAVGRSAPSLQQQVSVEPGREQDLEVSGDYWRNAVRMNQHTNSRSVGG